MIRRLSTLALATVLISLAGTTTSSAAVGPYWDVQASWGPTNLPPGGVGQVQLQARNVGDEVVEEDLEIVEQLPVGVKAADVFWEKGAVEGFDLSIFCSGIGTETVSCDLPGEYLVPFDWGSGEVEAIGAPFPEGTGYLPQIFIEVEVAPSAVGSSQSIATVSGGGAAEPFTDEDQITFSGVPAPFGLRSGSLLGDNFTDAYPLGEPLRRAGDRPFELRVDFELTHFSDIGPDGTRYIAPTGLARTVEATLPRGMIGNPEATPKCDPVDFGNVSSKSGGRPACPADTQVGYLNVSIVGSKTNYGRGSFANPKFAKVPLFNLEPPKGVPADFAFDVVGTVQGHIYPTLDPAQGYAIKSLVPNISEGFPVRSVETVIWGVPGDPAHDRFRYDPDTGPGASFGSAAIRPLLTNPTDCGEENGGVKIRLDSYQRPGEFSATEEYGDPLNVGGCDDPRFRFEPDIAMQPSDTDAGAPTGLAVNLEVPQRNDEVDDAGELYAPNGFLKGIATPPMKKAVVTLPEGMTISPSAAQGLETCSLAQIGLGTNDPVACPDGSQYGELTIHTPILPVDAPPKGRIYIAEQFANPNNNFISLYLVVEEPDRGILVKVPGRVDLDQVSGQIKTTFDDLPQFPVSDLELTLKGGVRAALVNPSTCGRKTITAEFFSWHDPDTPHVVKDSYDVTEKPNGSPCVNGLGERPFAPGFEAGMLTPTAGAFSPFLLRLTRSDDDQELSQLGATLPPGLSASFAGVGECTDAGIARAIARSAPGDAALELGDPSCPPSSLIGTTQVGTGVGVPLTYVPGKVYLGGPYGGAPFSVVVITPALVGPYDLGVIAVRSALRVDRETARGSFTSDPFPQIFQGIPVRIRDVRVKLDRDRFTLNPTSCDRMTIAAHVTGTGGDVNSAADDTVADLFEPFQASSCASLGFAPRLSMSLLGATRRVEHPRLVAKLRPRRGNANIAGAAVTLPSSAILDQGNIRSVCTRVQFAQKACPPGSVYGNAEAKTPLLDGVLKGPVYLRSSSRPLPDLVAALRGRVEFDVVGHIDAVNGKLRSTFNVVPDVPVTSFRLSMRGGKRGLLFNTRNLCLRPGRADAHFKAHNGKAATLRPKIDTSCQKSRKSRRSRP